VSLSSLFPRHYNREVNLDRKRCADGHENDDFDTTTASML